VAKVGTYKSDSTISLKRLQCVVESKKKKKMRTKHIIDLRTSVQPIMVGLGKICNICCSHLLLEM